VVAVSNQSSGAHLWTIPSTAPVERQVPCVEEIDLADAGVERVDAERRGGRLPILIRHRELQLDAVRVTDESEQLLDLGAEEPGRGVRAGHESGSTIAARRSPNKPAGTSTTRVPAPLPPELGEVTVG